MPETNQNDRYRNVKVRPAVHAKLRVLSLLLNVTMLDLVAEWVERDIAERGLEADVDRLIEVGRGA